MDYKDDRLKTVERLAGIENEIKHIGIDIKELSECFKQCQIATVIMEQKNIQIRLRWMFRITSIIGGLFGSAIFFLLVGHYQIMVEWFRFILRK